MKKIFCILLVLACIAGMVGCAKKNTIPEDSVTVYVRREKPIYGTTDGVVGTGFISTDGFDQNISYLLDKYFKTTPGEGFVSPFPKDLTVVSFKLEGLTAKVVLNDRIAELSGIDLTIALTCLTKTIMELTDCEEVIIRAVTKQLDGQKFITLSRDSFLLLDNSGEHQN